MTTRTLTAAELLPLLKKLVPRMGDAQVIGVHHDGSWSGNERLVVEGETLAVQGCGSLLEVHDALAQLGGDERLVLISPYEARELGVDVLSRFVRQELVRPRPLSALLSQFGATNVDARVARADWMIDELLRLAPPDGYARPEAGTLTYDRAWRELVQRGLGLSNDHPTVEELVRWGAHSANAERIRAAPSEALDALRSSFGDGGVAATVLAAITQGPEAASVTGGLTARLLEPDERAAGLFEAEVLGGARLRAPGEWADAAELVALDEANEDAVDQWVERAQDIVDRLHLSDRSGRSPVLPLGFELRLGIVGQALARRDGAALTEATTAVRRHLGVHAHPRLPAALDMVERLARRPALAVPSRLVDAVEHEVTDGSWASWARAVAADAAIGAAADAVGALLSDVDEQRREEAEAFAALVGQWDGDQRDGVLGVEDVMTRIVAPVVAAAATLVVVLDGLSMAVARELLDELTSAGWRERRPQALGRRPVAVATLPSLTKYSRSALLAGGLRDSGGQSVERAGFTQHPAVRQVSRGEPRLLHQRDLTSSTEGLPAEVVDALRSGPRLVGVVVNAVDDALSAGPQQRTRWTSEEVPVLRALLDAAAANDRAVIVLADHGHVSERPGMRRLDVGGSSSSGARWRTPDGVRPRPGEVLADGARVVGSSSIVLAADPALRYVAHAAAGYHGGASPEELVAPVLVLTGGSRHDQEGLVDQELDEPSWWRPEAATAIDLPPPTSAKRPSRSGQLALDGVAAPAKASASATGLGWVDALFEGSVFADQRQRHGRVGMDDERLRSIIEALAALGTSTKAALVARARLPAGRVDGYLATMRPLLNVEGVQVLTVDSAADAVRLDVPLLREQFGV